MAEYYSTPRGEGKPFNAAWLITAPWAHPVWSQYGIFLYDLTTPMPLPNPAPTLHMPDATYEVQCWALNPDFPMTEISLESPIRRLTPANWGYQFKAETDNLALARIQQYVDWINGKHLSPDTDFRRQWDALFHDGVTLLKR